MNKYLLLIFAMCGMISLAQNNSKMPYSYDNYVLGLQNTSIYETDPLDIGALLDEDENNMSGQMPRAGVVMPAALNMTNSGTWFDLPNGDKIWRLIMTVPNAIAVNLYFNDFYIPNGARLHAFSPGCVEVAANYDISNNPESGYYATEYVHGETIILEYYEPKEVLGSGRVGIEGINGFYDMIPPMETRETAENDRSGTCQVDVNCPEGDDWKKQRDATVRIIVKNNGQTGFCSGVLLNNTAEDCTPYILSAHHCATDDMDVGASAADFQQWVFYFDYQKSGCATGFATGFYTEIGAVKRANSHTNGGILGSDYILLELNDDLDETKEPYFAGWNANNIASPSGVGIHHPDGDYKKISTYISPTTTSNWSTSPFGSHWRVFWTGTTSGHGVNEGGSSGSGIFNDEGLVIGQLSGGSSECNDTQPNGQNQPDLYGKMSYNWNGGGNIQSLKSYLDPIGNGATKIMQGNYYLCSQGNGTINSVQELDLKENILVYPNPTSNNVTIDLYGLKNVNIELYNAVGVKVMILENQSDKTILEMHDVEPGIYYVRIVKRGVSKTQKVIKL